MKLEEMKLEQLEQKKINLVARLREIELERQTIELEKFIIVYYSAVPARIRATTNRAN